jgi:3-oxoacyl-[acyl-carrier protein] reductase
MQEAMLADKVVLVTGGSGAIGAEICRAAARYGARVAFTYHRGEERAAALAEEIGAIYERVESSDGEAVEAFVGRVERELERVDVLVNNLGMIQVMPFALIEEEDWDELLRVNLKGLFLFSRGVVRGMIRRRAGSIVNIGSLAGSRVLEVPVHYATAKAAVQGFTVSLAKELCRYGVRVNTVAPGLIADGIGDNVSERQLEEYTQYCTLGRAGTAQEVAELVCFVASDRASYINAQQLLVDGGI